MPLTRFLASANSIDSLYVSPFIADFSCHEETDAKILLCMVIDSPHEKFVSHKIDALLFEIANGGEVGTVLLDNSVTLADNKLLPSVVVFFRNKDELWPHFVSLIVDEVFNLCRFEIGGISDILVDLNERVE